MSWRILPILSILTGILVGCGLFSSEPEVMKLRQLTTNGGSSPTWSGDGKTIIYTDGGDLWMIDAGGGPPTQLTSLDGFVASPEFLRVPGSRRLAFVTFSFPAGARLATMELRNNEIKIVELMEYYIDMGSITRTADGSHLARNIWVADLP